MLGKRTHIFYLEDGRRVAINIRHPNPDRLTVRYDVIIDGEVKENGRPLRSLWNTEVLENIVRKKYELNPQFS